MSIEKPPGGTRATETRWVERISPLYASKVLSAGPPRPPLKRGQHPRPGIRDRHRVLEMRRARSVHRHDRPLIGERLRAGAAGIYHRLDRDRESGDELLTTLGFAVVGHLRLLVELGTDAMADQVADD